MNGQPTPIDSQLRDQLARRAAGRTPDDLLAEVLAAVDSAPATRARARWLRPMWRVPRLAAAGIGVTLVAILAVALAVPGLRADRRRRRPATRRTAPSRPPSWPRSWPARRSRRTHRWSSQPRSTFGPTSAR